MIDPDDKHTTKKLLETFGKHDCLRFGPLGKDDNEALYLTAIGLGYLLEVEAGALKFPHEIYAAGYKQGYEQCDEGY